jgi:hypothetical protein
MNRMYEKLADSFAASPDRHKSIPSLALQCEVAGEHILLGRAIGDKETELVIATLYACVKGDNRFVFFRASEMLQGFIVGYDPLKFVTLSELGYIPEHNASVGIVTRDGQSRWVDSVGRGDGSSYWLVEPRWTETLQWLKQHVPT